ncbi:hypothetical protein H9P43_002843 [Blastocladiella emersonii ATCC 22665]|nr:hypothetical protein H9P43_002843 [Blastocladiella emersonii ATCC 22665]
MKPLPDSAASFGEVKKLAILAGNLGELFAEKEAPLPLASAPPVWEEIYAPLDHVPDDAYDNLMKPPSFDEFHAALSASGPTKAPGPSGVQTKLWLDSGPEVLDALHRVVCAMFAHRVVPDGWKTSMVVTIP